MDKVKFFTHYDRPECDCEHYEEGTSLTVPDQVEPVSVTVSRCMRGELLKAYNEKDPFYEFDGNVNIDDVKFDDTLSPGFDLADVPSLVESAKQADMTASQEAVAKQETSSVTQEAPLSETESKDNSNQSKE